MRTFLKKSRRIRKPYSTGGMLVRLMSGQGLFSSVERTPLMAFTGVTSLPEKGFKASRQDIAKYPRSVLVCFPMKDNEDHLKELHALGYSYATSM